MFLSQWPLVFWPLAWARSEKLTRPPSLTRTREFLWATPRIDAQQSYEFVSSDEETGNDAISDEDEGGDRQGSTEGAGGHYNDESTSPAGRAQKGGMKGIKGVKQSMRQMSAVAKTVQDLLGALRVSAWL